MAAILGSSLSFIDVSAVNLALPAIQEDLVATATQAQWILEASGVVAAALLLLGGSLGDRLGRKRVFGAGTVIFTLSSVACGISGGSSLLVAARVLLGIGSALMIPGSLSLIGSIFPEGRRAFAAGIWSGATAVAIVTAQLLGGWMVDALTWRAVFLIPVPIAALVLILLKGVPETRSHDPALSLDWQGAFLGTAALGALVWGLLEAPVRGLGLATGGAVLAGLLLLAVFFLFERRHPFPLVPTDLLRSRGFLGLGLATFLLYGGFTGSLFFLPFNLIQVQGYTALQAGAANLPFILVMAALSPVSGFLAGRIGSRRALVAGSVVTGAAFLLFALPGVGGSFWTTFFPAGLLLGLGFALTVPAISSLIFSSAPAGKIALASAMNSMISRVAGVMAIAAMGGFLVFFFSSELDRQLDSFDLPVAARAELEAEKPRLAAMRIPPSVTREQAQRLEEAVKWSFVGGFRRLLAAAAAMAAAAALSGALLLEDDGPRSGKTGKGDHQSS